MLTYVCQPTSAPVLRTTIRLNTELARRAKQYAAQHQKSFTDVVEEAITQLLAKQKSSAKEKRQVTFPVFGDPDKRITEAEYRAAIEEMYQEEAEYVRRGCK